MHIGKSLKHFIKLHELTQEEVADTLYVSQQRVSKLCQSKTAGSRTIERLAKAFGVTEIEFIKAGIEE